MRAVAGLAGFLLLSGCAEYQERQNEARFAGYQQRCEAYGLQLGSAAFMSCMEKQDNQDQANRRAIVGAVLANQQPQPRPYVLPMPAPVQPAPQLPAPRMCQSVVNGQTITTNCY